MASTALKVLLFQGDAEAQLLARAGVLLGAALPHCAIEVVQAWATRPDLLDRAAPPPPKSLQERGLLPAVDVRDLLATQADVVVFTLLAGVAIPVLRHVDGGAFVAHRTLQAPWSGPEASEVGASCKADPAMAPGEAAEALAPIIERLQEGGAAVAVCTTFRHVREPLQHRRAVGPSSLRDLIRGCNLEAARLSRRTGCFVLDLDRPLAQAGGARLDADCWGGGERAAELALDELMALLLDAVPDCLGLPEVT